MGRGFFCQNPRFVKSWERNKPERGKAGRKTVWRLWKKQRGAEEEGRKSEGKRLAADLFWCGGKPGKAGTQWVCDRKWLPVRVCKKGRAGEGQGKRSRAADAKANSRGKPGKQAFLFRVFGKDDGGENRENKLCFSAPERGTTDWGCRENKFCFSAPARRMPGGRSRKIKVYFFAPVVKDARRGKPGKQAFLFRACGEGTTDGEKSGNRIFLFCACGKDDGMKSAKNRF